MRERSIIPGSIGFFVLLSVMTTSFCLANASDDAVICDSPAIPVLVLETIMGPIEIELAEAAAPDAVRSLVRLVKGPVLDSELTAGNPYYELFGYYDGLEIIHVLRGTELITATRPPRHGIVIPTQIDADALGLDQEYIEDPAHAMQLWQHTLVKRYINARTEEDIHPRLIDWVKANARTGQVDFLLNASIKEINEALGHRYVAGLPSLPVTRGSVSLKPLNPRWSTPALHISLRDRPGLTGKQMVIGRVVAGLELAEQLSTHRLTPEKTMRNRPMVPIVIARSSIICRDSAAVSSSTFQKGKEIGK